MKTLILVLLVTFLAMGCAQKSSVPVKRTKTTHVQKGCLDTKGFKAMKK